MATINGIGNGLSGTTGTGNFVGANTPTLVTPTLGVATATSINFGGTTLSNYLTGSWTPTFTFATVGNLSVAYTTQNGSYTRFGNVIVAYFLLTCTPTYTTATGQAIIGGLPVVAALSTDTGAIGAQTSIITYPASCTMINFVTSASTSNLLLQGLGSAVGVSSLTNLNFTTASSFTLAGTISYHV